MLIKTFSSVLSACLIAASTSGQRHIVSSFYTKSNISDSSVVICTFEYQNDKWEPRYSQTNTYFYEHLRLVRAVQNGQNYRIRYKRKHVAIRMFNEEKKKVSDYLYVYDSTKRISHANHYVWEKGKKSFGESNISAMIHPDD